MQEKKVEIEICLGSSCFSRGNKEVVNDIQDFIGKNHPGGRIVFRGARCMGNCLSGPNIIINGKTIEGVNHSDIEKILENELGHKRI